MNVKLLLFVVLCGWAACDARRPGVAERRGASVFFIAMGGYALYSGARVLVTEFAPAEGWHVGLFTTGVASVASAVTVLLGALAVLLTLRDTGAEERALARTGTERLSSRARSLLRQGERVCWSTAEIRDPDLLRRSFGPEFLRDVRSGLVAACRDAVPAGAPVEVTGPTRVSFVTVEGQPIPDPCDLTDRLSALPSLDGHLPDIRVTTRLLDRPATGATPVLG